MAQLGKRYRCETCGTEILCTKNGDGAPGCCGNDMPLQEPKKLASSD
ncbi:MAG: desulforedoxin [Deltaproteobacteria bacterium]|nr:desulforedoxin [Deltaproteobacteria bacterium]